jgi:TetR/AcrR family transcriptional regulator, transcriptional repressor of aconitase
VPKISEEAKEARREAILEAARRCFADHGYEGATVARLEAGTGLSRGAIFNYFESKEHLFLALADRDAERFAQHWLEGGFEEVLRTLLSEDPAWLGVYFEVGRRLRTDEAFRERWSNRTPDFEQQLAERLQRLQEEGELRTDVGWRTIARFMSIVADGLVVRRATGYETDDADDLIALAADAVRPRPRRARETVSDRRLADGSAERS